MYSSLTKSFPEPHRGKSKNTSSLRLSLNPSKSVHLISSSPEGEKNLYLVYCHRFYGVDPCLGKYDSCRWWFLSPAASLGHGGKAKGFFKNMRRVRGTVRNKAVEGNWSGMLMTSIFTHQKWKFRKIFCKTQNFKTPVHENNRIPCIEFLLKQTNKQTGRQYFPHK